MLLTAKLWKEDLRPQLYSFALFKGNITENSLHSFIANIFFKLVLLAYCSYSSYSTIVDSCFKYLWARPL